MTLLKSIVAAFVILSLVSCANEEEMEIKNVVSEEEAWSYMMACNGLNVPQMVEFEASSVGSYSTSRINSNDVTNTVIAISGLQPSASSLLFSGFFNREGTQSITTNLNTRSLSSKFNADLVNVLIDKSNYSISSGGGTFVLSGLSENIPFSFYGTIVFNGNGSVSLTVNENNYEININE